MEREKQISEMAKDLCLLSNTSCSDCKMKNHCLMRNCAECFYNAGYRKQEWISVEDRLPQNDYLKSETERKKYLVYTEPRGIMYEATFGYEEHNWWVTKESIFERVLSLDFGEDVTYYMPLPTPPKMKGADNENS